VDSTNRLLVIAGATIGAVVGARIVGALENLPAWLSAPSFWAYFYGNKTLVGGLLGGLCVCELVKKIVRRTTEYRRFVYISVIAGHDDRQGGVLRLEYMRRPMEYPRICHGP
jgi:hypothetical protein